MRGQSSLEMMALLSVVVAFVILLTGDILEGSRRVTLMGAVRSYFSDRLAAKSLEMGRFFLVRSITADGNSVTVYIYPYNPLSPEEVQEVRTGLLDYLRDLGVEVEDVEVRS